MGLSLVLVFVIGLAAHRASLCAVRAVMQWVEERRAGMLVGFVLGSLAVVWLQSAGALPWPQGPSLWWFRIAPGLRLALVLALLLWALWQVQAIWRCRPRGQRPGQWLLAPKYRLSVAALLLGVASALRFLTEGPWTDTNCLRELSLSWVQASAAPGAMRLLLVATLFAGMVASSVQRGWAEAQGRRPDCSASRAPWVPSQAQARRGVARA